MTGFAPSQPQKLRTPDLDFFWPGLLCCNHDYFDHRVIPSFFRVCFVIQYEGQWAHESPVCGPELVAQLRAAGVQEPGFRFAALCVDGSTAAALEPRCELGAGAGGAGEAVAVGGCGGCVSGFWGLDMWWDNLLI